MEKIKSLPVWLLSFITTMVLGSIINAILNFGFGVDLNKVLSNIFFVLLYAGSFYALKRWK